MAKVKLAKPKRKGEPPKHAATVANLAKPSSGQTVPLQVKIPQEVRAEFKSYAAARDLQSSHLFLKMWNFYKEHQS